MSESKLFQINNKSGKVKRFLHNKIVKGNDNKDIEDLLGENTPKDTNNNENSDNMGG